MNNDDHSKHAEEMLRQVWNNHFPHWSHLSWDPLFSIDESLAAEIAHSLHPFPAEMAATLDCWRDKMVAAIDEIVQQFKNNPNPPLDC
jgi:hypothetical protein